MSRVECDHCGARYELSDETPALEGASAPATVTCRECGAPARSSATDSGVPVALAAAEPLSIDVAVTTDAPEAETIPAPQSDPDGQEEPVTTRTPNVLRDATDPADEDEKTVTRQPDLGAEDTEDAPPPSATPSIEALVAARGRRESKEAPPASRSFLEGPRYDFRPPDIQVESSPRSRLLTDAPVAGTNRPPAPAPRSGNRAELLVALALFSAAGAFFTLKALRRDANESAEASAANSVLPVEAVATEAPSAPADQEPPLAPAPEAQAAPSPVEAQNPSPVAPEAGAAEEPSVRRLVRRSEPPVVPASLKTEDARAELEPTPPSADAAFNPDAASQALATTAKQASSCRKSSDPSGVATVIITFSPSGRVTTAQVSGPPFAGTETGSCIASELRKTRVPAFSGDFVTVKKTLTIQ